jgi:hypothetical protein
MSLLDVLKGLDPLDDTLWTEDGLPVIDVVRAIANDPKITRIGINKVALGLTRSNVKEYTTAPQVDSPVAETVVATSTVEAVPLTGVAALLAEIEAIRVSIVTKQEEVAVINKAIRELELSLIALELKVPVRDLYLENERKNIEGFAARSEKEDADRLANIAKLEASGLTVAEIMELVPKQQVLNYVRIV